jgi:branched-chain amino acid transport system ATP-binding protein
MLEVDGLVVSYGGIEALHGVSLHVAAGEIVGLLGPNGAGKSSTLAGIMGLVRPAAGRVRFEGTEIAGRDTETIVRSGLSLVPERRRLFGHLSVSENLLLGGASRKDRAAAARDREWVTDLFPVLRDRLGQQAGLLSGGEAQQLAIARALMSGPRLLLLDEPSLGLAPRLVDKVFDLVQTLRDEGLTILIVEQNAYQVLELTDRAYVLRNGAVVDEGTGAELLEREDLCAQYMGSSAPACSP